MKKSIAFTIAIFISFIIFGQSTPLNGTYTLGDPTSDFLTFTDAINALDSVGVNGPVIFDIKTGTYYEHVEFGVIQGASALNTITFRSETGINTDVIIEYAPPNGNYVLRLNGSDYMRIKYITFRATGIAAPNVINLINGANYNLFEGNVIEAPKTNSASTCVANSSTTNEHYNIFRSNLLINGYRGFYFNASSSSYREKGNIIEGNRMLGFTRYGIYAYYQDSLRINSNYLKNMTITSDAIYLKSCDHFNITQNKIFLYGINSEGVVVSLCMGEVNNPNLIANNFISTSGVTCLSNDRSYYTDIYYNSINNVNPYTYSRSILLNGPTRNNLKNNIFCNSGGGYSLIVNDTNSIQSSDNNDFFTSGPIIALWTGDTVYNLGELQNISGLDSNSVTIIPPYVSDTNLYLKHASLNGLADPSVNIIVDVDGNPRSTPSPTIGAHEFVSIPFDAGVSEIIQPVDTLNEDDVVPVELVVSNYGLNTITNMDISFYLNNGAPVTQSYTNPLLPSTSDTVTLSDITISQSNSVICAYTNCPGDSNSFNDTQYGSYFGRSLYNVSLVDIENLLEGCGLGFDTVKVFIRNDGLLPVNSGLTASYQVGGISAIVNEVVTNIINPGDTALFAFSSLVDLSVTATDSLFNVKVWIDINGDIYHDEDTTTMSVTSLHIPLPPLVSDTSIYFGTNAILHAISPDSILWYENDTTSNVMNSGPFYQTPNLFDSTTYWVETYEILPVVKITEITQFTSGVGATPQYPPYITSYFEGVEITNMGTIPADLSGYTMNFYGSMKGSWTFPDGVVLMPGEITLLNCESTGSSNPSYNYYALGMGIVSSGTSQCYFIKNQVGVLIDAVATNGATFPLYSGVTSSDWSGNIPSSQGNAGVVRIFSDNNNASDWANSDSIVQTIGSLNPSLVGMINIEKSCPSIRVPVTVYIQPPFLDDAGVEAIISPGASVPSNSPIPINVIVRNNGANTLTSVMINWELDGISKPTFQWTGSILSDSVSAPITIATDTFNYGVHQLKVWTSMPNSNTDSLNLNDTIQISFVATLNGSYSVGNQTSDFPTLTDVISTLDSIGVGGAVIFNIEPGIYDEQLCIKEVYGASAINTITFQSSTGDSTSVIITHDASGSNDFSTIKLDGVDYLIIKEMTIKGTGTYSFAVELLNGASNNEISNNIIECKWGAWNNIAIYENNSINPHNRYTNNKISNCWTGINVENNSPSLRNKGTVIENNLIYSFQRSGIRLSKTDSTIVHGNLIESDISLNPEALSLYQCNNYQILNNKIYIDNKISGNDGILLMYCDGSSMKPSLIANNFITITNSPGNNWGIFVRNCNNIDIYYNSINIIYDLISTGGAIFFDEGGDINCYNNIFNNDAGCYALKFAANLPVSFSSDYNNFNSSGANLFYLHGNISDLSSFQDSTGLDMHSLSVDPEFISPTDLHTSSFDLDSTATPLTSIINDIDGDPRDPNFPDIGADEYTIKQYDAGILNINEPNLNTASGNQDVRVCLKNFSVNTLTSVIINSSINGNIQTPYYWAGSLSANGIADSVILGQYNIPSGQVHLNVWTSSPNGQVDEQLANDTSKVSIISCSGQLSGIYTIGDNNSDYQTFNEAIKALNFCGVGGPVIFNVEPGLYEEQLVVSPVTGASDINTITFQSSTGDSTSVTLFYAPLRFTYNYIVKLNGADYFIFKHLTIKSTSYTDFGNVIVLANGADYNEFSNNIIQSNNHWDATCITDNFTQTIDNYNVIKNNWILNADLGINLSGNLNNPEKGTIIERNIIENFKSTGIRAENQDSLKIASNIIRRVENIANSWQDGIYLKGCSNTMTITNNNISLTRNGISELIGIQLHECTGNSSQYALIANNMISLYGGVTSHAIGLRSFFGSYTNYYNNTINVDCINNYSSNLTFYLQQNSDTINVINNIFINKYSGYDYYVYNSQAIGMSDNNDLLSDSQYLAYWDGNFVDLQALQAASGKDLNSVSVDPGFVSNTNLHIISNAINGLGMPLSILTTDIDGDIRDSLNPDIGADEFDAYNLDAGMISYVKPEVGFDTIGSLKSVEVVVKNFGIDTISGFDLGYLIPGSPIIIEQFTDTLFPLDIDTFLFSVQFITPVGQFNLKAFTNLQGDQVLLNDTITKSFTGLQTIQTAYFNDFEGGGTKVPGDIWITVPSNNQWEHGVPSANTINHAFSGSQVWATVLDSSYSNKRTDYLYTPIFDLSKIGITSLSFWHWICSEPQNDGGYIEYLNNQSNWIVLGTVNDLNATNWYNTFKGNQHLWSGKSNGWIYSKYNLASLSDIGTITQFRYVFTSNINIVEDGWAIDNFELGMPLISEDAGVNRIIYPHDTTLANNNVYVQIEILNFGTDTLFSIPVSYSVDGGPIITEIWNGILPSNTSDSYTFSTPFISPLTSTYVIEAFTGLINDQYELNDTIMKSFISTQSFNYKDIGITKVIEPTDTTIIGQYENVKIEIKNCGTDPLYSIPLYYSIDGGSPVVESWTGTLMSNDSAIFTFFTLYALSTAGSYNLCVNTCLVNDINNLNDTLCKTLISDTSTIVHDAGIAELISPLDTTIVGTFEHVTVVVKNFGMDTLSTMPLSFKIKNGSPVEEIWNGILVPNAVDTFTFGTPFLTPADLDFEICVYTSLDFDIYGTNDTLCKLIVNNPFISIYDIGVNSIILPGDSTDVGSLIDITVEIQNFDNDTLLSSPIRYQVDGGLPVNETWNGFMLPSAIDTFVFNTQFITPLNSLFEICVYSSLANDINSHNDTICKSVVNLPIISIPERENVEFWLGQNIPNPANNTTIINYSVPTNGNVIFRIFDATGQMVYSRSDEVIQGKVSTTIDLSRFSTGIYYYSIDHKGRRLVRKMIVAN